MRFIGFNLTKILAQKSSSFNLPVAVKPNVSVTNLEKFKLDYLNDLEALKVDFKYSITYTNPDSKDETQAELQFEGNILFAPDEDELKNVLKSWKKKQISPEHNLLFINLILKRCAVKALVLEEDLNLPPFPQLPRAQLESEQK